MRRRLKRSDRNHLAGEHRWSDTGQLVLLFVFLAVWIIDSFVLRYATFLTTYVPIYIRVPVAIVFLVLSGYLAMTGLNIVFDATREKPGVVSEGVFGIVRHPIYLGSVLFYLVLLVLTLSLAATVVWLVIIVFYHYIAQHEEKLLLMKFGAEYEEYMKAVPMWLPRIGLRKQGTASRE
jgi:protein-S-isoprenylcysteine O-methyltransferase Ste14